MKIVETYIVYFVMNNGNHKIIKMHLTSNNLYYIELDGLQKVTYEQAQELIERKNKWLT